jgi:hypothetical protein
VIADRVIAVGADLPAHATGGRAWLTTAQVAESKPPASTAD